MLLATVLEGGLRKWLLPAPLHSLAYISKDVLALAFIVHAGFRQDFKNAAVLRDRVILITALLLPALTLGLTWSVSGAVIVFKNAVLWPLFAIYMAIWFDWDSLRKITKLLAILCVGMAILGVIQFQTPISSFWNRYAWHVMGRMERIATFGASSNVRATGTFSYITGYSTFASVAFLWMTWRLLNASKTLDRCLCLIGCVCSVVCILTSGSRAPLYQCLLGLIAAIIVSSHIRYKLQGFTLIGMAITAYFVAGDGQLVESFFSRLTAADDSPAERISGKGMEFLPLMIERPFGIGLGQQSNVSEFRIAEQVTDMKFTEDGRSRLAIEGGALAVLAQLVTLSLFLSITLMSWRTRQNQSRIAAALMMPTGLYLFTNSLWYDHNVSALWWFFIGAWLAVTFRVTRQRDTFAPVMAHITPSTYAAYRRKSPVWEPELL